MNSTYRVRSTNYLLTGLLILFVLSQSVMAQPGLGGMTPSALQAGAPAGSYAVSDFENVNLFSGNLNFYLPLAKVGGRGSAATTVGLPIEIKWAVGSGTFGNQFVHYPYVLLNDVYDSFPLIKTKMRMRYGGDTIIPCRRPNDLDPNYTEPYYSQTLTRLSFTDVNGTEYELVDTLTGGAVYSVPRDSNNCPTANGLRGSIFVTKDGATATFVSDGGIGDVNEPGLATSGSIYPTGNLHLSDGTVYRFVNGNVDWIRDRNGNVVDFSYSLDEQGWLMYTITDSLNRKVTIRYFNNHPTYGDCRSVTYSGFGGQTRTAYITYTNLSNALRSGYSIQTFLQLFPQLTGANNGNFNDKVVSSLILPDGRSYNFRYDSYGYLARVETPLGAAIEYDWSTGASGMPASGVVDYQYGIYRRVTERRFYGNGTTLDYKTEFSRPESFSTTSGFSTIGYVESDVKTANNTRLSKSRHYFYGSAVASFYASPLSYSNPYEGREHKTETFDLDGTTVLRRVTTSWMQRNGSTWTSPPTASSFNDPQAVETTTELLDVSPKLVRKSTHIDPNNSSSIAFDAFNNPTDTWDYDWGQNAPGAFLRRTHTDYVTDTNYTGYTGSHLRRLPSQMWVSSDAAGNSKVSRTLFEYDNYTTSASHAPLVSRSSASGHETANFGTSYTRRGNVTAVTNYGNAQNQTDAVTAYSQYDILGNVVKSIDAAGNVSIISYNDNFGSPDGEARTNSAPTQLNGLNTFAFPTSMTNPLGWTAYTQFDYFTGAPVNTEDINGVISKTVYNDPLDRPTQAATGVGTSLEVQTTITYDDANYKVQQTSDLNSLNDNLLKTVGFYDKTGRSTETRTYEANGDYKAVQTQYDAMGRAYKVSNPFRPTEINTNNPILWTTRKFDALGRVTEIETPDGAKVLTAYSGNAVTVTDQAGKPRRSITNALGQLIRVDEPNGAGQLDVNGVPAQSTAYEYDVLNNLKKVTQGVQVREFFYDSLSQLKEVQNPESGTILYTYDLNGNLQTKRDARGIRTIYEYDALDRIIKRCYTVPNPQGSPTNCSQLTTQDTSQTTLPVAYTYDNLTNSKGKLTKMVTGAPTAPFSTTEYLEFDIFGKVKKSKQTTDNLNIDEITYSYNLAGSLVEQKYPSGRVVRNVLEADGDLSIVQSRKNQSAGFFNYAKHLNYTAAGALSALQLGNGRWESTQFNSRLQATQIALGTIRNGTDKLKLNFDYGTTQNNGNVLSQTITVPTETRNNTTHTGFTATQVYTYDSLNRIKDAVETIGGSQQWKQTFTYDRYGNRNFDAANTTTLGSCSAAQCNPTVDAANNRFTTAQGYVYDSSGNLVTDAQGRTFTYDGENKQTEVFQNSVSVGRYFYDGAGSRVKKIAGNEETIFIYDAAGKLVAEYSNQISQTPQVSYLTSDTLGTPRANSDANGNITARHDYQPFGAEIARTSYGSDEVRNKFTAYERDGESGLDFAQARYYNFNHGRFTSTDPVIMSFKRAADPQRINLYAYSRNNPLKYVDPDGEDIEEPTNLSEEDQEAYEKWKNKFLSTPEGRKTWERYKNDRNFKLKIVVTDRGSPGQNRSAKVDDFKFDANGNLIGATMTLGRNLGKGLPSDSTSYPLTSALETESSADIGASKIAHEFGHLDDFRSLGRTFFEQQQILEAYSKRGEELRKQKAYNDNDPTLKKLESDFSKSFGVDMAQERINRDRRADKQAIPTIKQIFGNSLSSGAKKAIKELGGN